MKLKTLTKNEKREYLKPYRKVGGYILFICLFMQIIIYLVSSINAILSSLTTNEYLQLTIKEIIMYGSIIYTYYIGYRIFIKKDVEKPFKPLKQKEKLNPIKCLISIICGFIVTRLCWIIWVDFLEHIHFDMEAAGMEVGLVGMLYAFILAPFFEELLFRGWFREVMKKYNTFVTVIISSLAFGIFHMTVTQTVPAIIIGIVLSIIAIKNKSLIPSIIVHILSNVYSTFESIIFKEEVILTLNKVFIVLSLIIIVIYIILHIKKTGKLIKGIGNTFRIIPTSLSYIFFILLSGLTIFTELNNCYNFIKIDKVTDIIKEQQIEE